MVKYIVTVLLLRPWMVLAVYSDFSYTGLKITCVQMCIAKFDKFTSNPLIGKSCASAVCVYYVRTVRYELWCRYVSA